MRLTPDQERICDAVRDYPRVAVQASHGVGKCVAGSEWLTVNGGERVQAKDLIGREFWLTTLSEGGVITQAKAYAEKNRREAVFALTTVQGHQVVRNAKHPLWAGTWSSRERTVRPKGWSPIAALGADDYVAVPVRLPAQGGSAPTEYLYLAGALYADGNAAITFPSWVYGADEQHREMLKACAARQGVTLMRRSSTKQADRLMPHDADTARGFLPFWAWLAANGAPKSDAQMNYGVPWCLWGVDNARLAVFLEAAFRQGASDVHGRPVLRSVSARFLRETQELLLRFALTAQIDAGELRIAGCRGIAGLRTALAGKRGRARKAAWLTEYAPPAHQWVKVAGVKAAGTEETVAIQVPATGTFITTLYEHNTYIMAGLTLWRYVCFPDAQIITTAPGEDSVKDLLWGVIRKLWYPRPGLMPSAPELHNPDRPRMSHYAVGRVAAKGEGFQGRHDPNLMVVMDEAVGIERQFFLAASSMCTDPDNRWVIIFNPTDVTSAAYQASQDPDWHVLAISALTHPNMLADLAGEARPFPGAVSREWFEKLLKSDSTRIEARDRDEGVDIEWPPGSGEWWHPGFDTETRGLGRWPSVSTDAIWSEQMWASAMTPKPLPAFGSLVLGCDVASTGENDTAIVVRLGPCALYAETGNNWSSVRTAERLRELCNEYGEKHHQNPVSIIVNVDETGGYGRGVLDQSFGYSFVGVHSSSKAMDEAHYPNRRSELWFTTANLARLGEIDFSRLPPDFLRRLRANYMGVRWVVNPANQHRVVEPKAKTIRRLGASPDPADAANLAYAGGAVTLPMLAVSALSGGWSKR